MNKVVSIIIIVFAIISTSYKITASNRVSFASLTSLDLQTDQKIIAVGSAGDILDGIPRLIIARYMTDGSYDSSFNGGFVTQLIGDQCEAHSVTIQLSDEKSVVVGVSTMNNVNKLFLTRYNTDGSLDVAFGDDGTVIALIGDGCQGLSVTLQPSDEKIVVTGVAVIQGTLQAFVSRYDTNGSIDITFGTEGTVITSVDNRVQIASMFVQPVDEKIVIIGDVNDNQFLAIRYNTDGSLDTSFGLNGIALISGGNDTEGNGGALQADGKIILVGVVDNQGKIIRLNVDGSVDATFGTSGIVTLPPDTKLTTTLIQTDGKIMVAGVTANHLFMERYEETGIVDVTFDASHMRDTLIAKASELHSLAIQADDNIVSVGYSSKNAEEKSSDVVGALVIRVLSTGTKDGSFGNQGIVKAPDSAVAIGTRILITDEKVLGVNGGTFTANLWQTRTLNTVVDDTGSILLQSNQFTLKPGLYTLFIIAPAHAVGLHQIRLYCVTDAMVIVKGESISSINSISYSTIFTQISLSSQKIFEIQHMAENTQLDDGFGIATGFGANELYTRVVITVL